VRKCNVLILACRSTAWSMLALAGSLAGGAEVIPTPAPSAGFQQSMAAPGPAMSPTMNCEIPGTPPTRPWYYWWDSWHWFDRCHDRGQHYAYPPPLPGWYYFKPYSVGQLRAQQEMVMRWGGDPRNPYADGVLSQVPQRIRKRPAPPTPSSPSAPRPSSSSPPSAVSATNVGRAGYATTAATGVEALIPWPPVLCDRRFAEQRAKIEAPFRRSPGGQPKLSPADCQSMIDAIEQMEVILGQMTSETSVHDSFVAGKFLDQLATETRQQAQIALASAGSEPLSFAPATGVPSGRQ
jgi:hypothetical protein